MKQQVEQPERIYTVPARLMGRMVAILNRLPYEQVAGILGPLGSLLMQQDQMFNQKEMTGAKEATSKTLKTGPKKGSIGEA